jgi:hypothetical protein
MYAQCDIEGRQYNLMEGMFYHKTDVHAVEPDDMYIKHGSKKPKAGMCVLNGKMGLQDRSACRISRKATPLKLITMILQRDCLTLLILCGGAHMSSRSAAELLPLSPNVTTSGLASLELRFPRTGVTV